MSLRHRRPHTPGAAATLLVALLFCAGSAASARAQQSTTEGWMLGVEFGVAALFVDDAPRDSGAHVGLRAGYGLNRTAALYLAIYETDFRFPGFTKVTMGHVDAGVRLHLADSRRRLVPYADLAVTLRVVQDNPEPAEPAARDFSGWGPTFGGGLAVYLSESWALDVNSRWSTGAFKNVPERPGATRSGDVDADTVRLTAGISWWP